jgi:uncharacterized membrane protein
MDSRRDTTLDIMRGLAVFLMVQGNMAGGLLVHPYPTWIQVYVALGSFVPALFILIAGMMVAYTSLHKGYTLKHYCIRGVGLLIAAALVLDVLVWRIVPFVGMDVLYLIALSLPLSYLFLRLGRGLRWGIVVMLFLATPLLQAMFGYADTPVTIPLFHPLTASFLADAVVLKHWLIDGWFPIFPWLGFAFLGVNIGLMRWKDATLKSFATKRTVLWGASLVFFGALIWALQGQSVFVREGYSEAIYPPTLGYIITALGEIVLLVALIDWRPKLRMYNPLIVFGQSALFMYIAHFALMEYLWPGLENQFALLGLIALSLGILLWLGYWLRAVRTRHPKRSGALRVLGI